MAAFEVRTRTVGPWPMNSYVLVCLETKASALIDPGADPEKLHAMLEGTRPEYIILTHTHPDHVGALNEMRTQLGVPLLAHAGPHHNNLELALDQTLAHGDEISLGAGKLRIYATPGHAADLISLEDCNGDTIIVGDTVFAGGPGKTWSAEGFRTTLGTLREVVLTWPDSARCYPGHGPNFTMAELRPLIQAFCDREHPTDFFGDAEW